ncbi:hypothetical protein OE88DRAFT_1733610 [Heliocybe sulcata]|uniref:Uncharacterized protein n=1 Tax=Heliocybe sulcata TaxID=5364 RepID=A0A5C3N9G9_9AGAM|nr:hypothetical protein OE88DRAFT_1733610 [Heliocybe sulcata]
MTSVETIFSLALGLGLRGLVGAVTGPHATLSGILVGLWEGAALHHLAHASRSLDPYISYVLRVVIDYFWTEDSHRVIIVLLWTGLGMLLADVWPALSYVVIRFVYRCYKEIRRALYSLDYALSTAFTIPSRVRHYAESSASSSASSVSVRRQPRRVTSQPVPGAYTETSTIYSDYQESEVAEINEPSYYRQYEVPPGGENDILPRSPDTYSEGGSTVSRAPPPSHSPQHNYGYGIMSPTRSDRLGIRINVGYDDASSAASTAPALSAELRSLPVLTARAPSTVAPSVAAPSVIPPSTATPPRSTSEPWQTKTKSVVSHVTAAQMPLPESRASSVVNAPSIWQQPTPQSRTEVAEEEERIPSPDPMDPLQTPPTSGYRLPPMRGVFSDEDLNSPPEGPPPPFSFGQGVDALRLEIPGQEEKSGEKEKEVGDDEEEEEEEEEEEGEEKGDWEHVKSPAEDKEGDDIAPPTGAPGAEGKNRDEDEEEDEWSLKKKDKKGGKKKKDKGGKSPAGVEGAEGGETAITGEEGEKKDDEEDNWGNAKVKKKNSRKRRG